MIALPADLAGRVRYEGELGARWHAALPDTLVRLAVTWELTLGAPVEPGGVTSLVVPARRPDGEPLALKVPVPDAEQAGEAAGLALVAGDGAVRLVGHDQATGALLLERLTAARSLLDAAEPESAVDTAARLLARWWRPLPTAADAVAGEGLRFGEPPALATIPRLTTLAPAFADELEGHRPRVADHIPAHLLDAAIATLSEVPSDGDLLLHSDLHLGNVLAARREPWLAIDPKPLVGPAAWDVQALLRDGLPRDATLGSVARRRFDRVTQHLGVDRGLARDWVVARCVASAAWALAVVEQRELGERDTAVAVAVAAGAA